MKATNKQIFEFTPDEITQILLDHLKSQGIDVNKDVNVFYEVSTDPTDHFPSWQFNSCRITIEEGGIHAIMTDSVMRAVRTASTNIYRKS